MTAAEHRSRSAVLIAIAVDVVGIARPGVAIDAGVTAIAAPQLSGNERGGSRVEKYPRAALAIVGG